MRTPILFLIIAVTLMVGEAQTFAKVDINKIARESTFYKKKREEIEAAQRRYQTLIQALESSPLMTDEERQKVISIETSQAPSEQQKQEVQKILQEAQKRSEMLTGLQQKPADQLSAAEKELLKEYTGRQTKAGEFLRAFTQQLNQQFGEQVTKADQEVTERIRQAIAEVAKEKKVTVVFSADTVLYCDLDLTDLVIQRLNAQK